MHYLSTRIVHNTTTVYWCTIKFLISSINTHPLTESNRIQQIGFNPKKKIHVKLIKCGRYKCSEYHSAPAITYRFGGKMVFLPQNTVSTSILALNSQYRQYLTIPDERVIPEFCYTRQIEPEREDTREREREGSDSSTYFAMRERERDREG